ncbi:lysine 2,3-aminomutase [Streptomyces sp. NPDC051597]|uniref:KamA family radical SAM protein n=1 Tax=Streptomyces sp. NPDC051597 TaxID=3155049 RepID=UPI0034477CE5
MDRPTLQSVPGERLADLPQLQGLDERTRRDMKVVAAVLPFKVNRYVLEELIDWDRVPDDPLYRLTFPHRDMLPAAMFTEMDMLQRSGATSRDLREVALKLRRQLNPHPSGQIEYNIPTLDGRPVPGLQHKYRHTVLLFPAAGQTCHAYCGYCFRWAQFVGVPEWKQSLRQAEDSVAYLRAHPEVSDVLITGGDPMIMSADRLRTTIAPLLAPDLAHLQNIRIGTKALSYWPYRFLTDRDADDVLRLLEECVAAGRSVSVMAHFSHTRELGTAAAREAVARIRATGAVVRAQAPLVRYVNDDPDAWADMWREMVRLGIQPYYMFVERDTGAENYFAVPLARAVDIYHSAVRKVSGLARTARGPVMSATPGKVHLAGEASVQGERVFVCQFLQARDETMLGRPFFARWNAEATWYEQLRPAFDGDPFPFGTEPVAHGPGGTGVQRRRSG